MKTYSRLVAAGILLLALSCESPFEDSGQELEPLGGKVFVVVRDNYPNGDSSLPKTVLEIQTEHYFPCFNYAIEYNPYGTDTLFGFTLHGASLGVICQRAFGPARLIYPLDVQNGTYTIQIIMYNQVGTHTLVVTDSAYYVYGSSDISAPKDSVFWRTDVN